MGGEPLSPVVLVCKASMVYLSLLMENVHA